jgi:hypothetical protein
MDFEGHGIASCGGRWVGVELTTDSATLDWVVAADQLERRLRPFEALRSVLSRPSRWNSHPKSPTFDSPCSPLGAMRGREPRRLTAISGEVGEHRTLGGFYPVLHGEKVISGESIRDSPRPERDSRNRSSRHHGQSPRPSGVDRANREERPPASAEHRPETYDFST